MTNERWEEFIDSAKQRFENVELSTEDLYVEKADGEEQQGTIDTLNFTMAGTNFKVERENRPLVIDKKQHYSHRQGDTARTEYVLSDTEFSHRVKVYKENHYGDWEEIVPDALGL